MVCWRIDSPILGSLQLIKIQKSSANRDLDTSGGILCGRSLIAILKSVGLNTVPWGTPFSSEYDVDSICPILTAKCLLFRKLFRKNKIFPLIFHECRVLRILYFHIVSNALLMSKKTARK